LNCTTLESLRRVVEEAPTTRFVEVSPELYATLQDADLLDDTSHGGVTTLLRDTGIEIVVAGALPGTDPLGLPSHVPTFPEWLVYRPRAMATACLLEAGLAAAAIRHGYAPDHIGVDGMYGQYRGNSRLRHESTHRRDIACATLAMAMYWQQHHGLYDEHGRALDKDFLHAAVLGGEHLREQEIFWEGDPMGQYFSPLMRDTILLAHAEKLSEQLAERMPMVQALTRALWQSQTPLLPPRLAREAIIEAVRPLLAQDHPLIKQSEPDVFDLWAAQSAAETWAAPAQDVVPEQPAAIAVRPEEVASGATASSGLLARLRKALGR